MGSWAASGARQNAVTGVPGVLVPRPGMVHVAVPLPRHLVWQSGSRVVSRADAEVRCVAGFGVLHRSRVCQAVVGRRGQWRRWATADAAESAVEAPAEAVVEEETAPAEGANGAGEEPSGGILEALREAIASGEEALVAEVEERIRALEAENEALGGSVRALENDISTAKDRFLRLNADFDNFRKRSEREKSSLASKVKGDVVEALLPMVDSFERAKGALKLETEAEQRIDGSYQGIYKQFVEVMKGFGVAAVETVGKEFNPEFHEAIMREESEEFPDGVVAQEFRKGFVIGDRLVRPAMVKVSSGPGPAPSGEDSAHGASGNEAEQSS